MTPSGSHDAPAAVSPRLLLAVGLVAFVVRALHNQALLADPLYYHPLGGNTPYLELAERIAGGDFLPPGGAFTVSSPLYPYILAVLYKLFGAGSYYAVRLAGSVVDSGTCVLVAALACRRFGTVAGWVAGAGLAVYGPSIFFSTELAPVPYTLFLLSAALLLMDGEASWKRFGAAGLLLGLATATRPNVLLAGVVALAVPWGRGLPGARRLAGALAVGLAAGIAPVTLANLAAGGGFVPLTSSGGHNLYIGHNPTAQAQYTLPAPLDGDIFRSMKGLAESVEGHPLADGEVSGYYLRRAVGWAVTHPGRELRLFGRRALLLVNRFEATTYANYDYQKTYSPVLRWAPSFLWLFLLAAPGMLLAFNRRLLHLWIPVLTGAASVLLFFYIARLRVLVVPSLAVFAGAAAAGATTAWREGARRRLATGAIIAVAASLISALPLLRSDTSNEWNKAGGVLRLMGRFDEAAAALDRAAAANPDNPDTYRNLAVLYRQTGRAELAAQAEARAADLTARGVSEEEAFHKALEGATR